MLNVECDSAQRPFNIQHLPFNIPRSLSRNYAFPIRVAWCPGGEWGLVAPAVFKTVVSARKRRRVGSIPTRLRHYGGRRAAGGVRATSRPLPAARCPLLFWRVR